MSSVPPISPSPAPAPPPPPPPPPVEKAALAFPWWRKWSTWCGWLAAGCVGAFGFYALSPERAQNAVPDAVLVTLMVLGMGSGFAVAVATSIRQKTP